jgi:quinol monooxygenase YgiN
LLATATKEEKMAFVLITTAPSRDVYEQVVAEVGTGAPPGCIVHTASVVDGGVRVVDVWESLQAIDDYFQSTLGPAFAKLGVDAERPEIIETFNIERG